MDLEIQNLRAAVNAMDRLSQGGFTEIASIAKLALARLETPDGHQHIGDIANALKVIWGTADEIADCINFEAGNVGCNYVDESLRRRMAAEQAHRLEATTTSAPVLQA